MIVEEASFAGQYHEPAIQLLEYTDGSLAIRFCFYSPGGHFRRSPLILRGEDIEALRPELAKSPRLLAMLQELVE